MPRKISFLLFGLVLIASACNHQSQVNINGHIVKVELATTTSERQKGLSNRTSLAADSGMLFIFDKANYYGFWMKDMKFPLDFIWFRDSKVVDITPDVPNTNLNIYKPNEPADQVLEVNAGWSAQNNINIGDPVQLTK